MRADNSEKIIQQVQIMVFVQLKQGFFLRKSQICLYIRQNEKTTAARVCPASDTLGI